jgi:hypothetical protein
MEAGARPRWTLPRVLAAAFVVVWLAVQVGVPVLQHLTTEGARPFAWQMFSRRVEVPRFKVVTADGTETEVADWERYLGRTRLEVDFARHVPPHLCRVEPGAVAVTTYRDDGSGPVARLECR